MSDSAGTLWLDTEKREWSEKMLFSTHLSKDQMPTLVEGSEPGAQLSAKFTREWGLSSSPVIAGGAGDNAAGAIGMGAVEPGNAFISLGTFGVYFVVNPNFLPSPEQGVHAFCHCIPNTWHQMSHSQRFQLSELDCRRDPTKRIRIDRQTGIPSFRTGESLLSSLYFRGANASQLPQFSRSFSWFETRTWLFGDHAGGS